MHARQDILQDKRIRSLQIVKEPLRAPQMGNFTFLTVGLRTLAPETRSKEVENCNVRKASSLPGLISGVTCIQKTQIASTILLDQPLVNAIQII